MYRENNQSLCKVSKKKERKKEQVYSQILILSERKGITFVHLYAAAALELHRPAADIFVLLTSSGRNSVASPRYAALY